MRGSHPRLRTFNGYLPCYPCEAFCVFQCTSLPKSRCLNQLSDCLVHQMMRHGRGQSACTSWEFSCQLHLCTVSQTWAPQQETWRSCRLLSATSTHHGLSASSHRKQSHGCLETTTVLPCLRWIGDEYAGMLYIPRLPLPSVLSLRSCLRPVALGLLRIKFACSDVTVGPHKTLSHTIRLTGYLSCTCIAFSGRGLEMGAQACIVQTRQG